ncbi:MAG: hypothetical protein A2452_12760 [Candidatus Firestonebacteria bacterium RIFOXYC2_FULL_39_67]|nr:MAG: hypothetical protein A2536_12125 [Candidatus Firestonebacteria bacterium RIFOXYD2_FULL_39_29]OGF52819.1 MAG: hypothetical protein A2497_00945 [Candidatus Firestonebacteria bacterium RifOxyC12_full_39_7]OGF57434.1 MAG: hypothetical protein A2452_12760 [Candidatus Firestonebacteria bacterium RIFOXYC2_FULL_39_67]
MRKLVIVFCFIFAASLHAKVMLHSTFDSAAAINKPAAASCKNALSVWTAGEGKIAFEDGMFGKAARLHGKDKNIEILKINSMAVDFTNSGRIDFWLKFNEDPHKIKDGSYFYILCDISESRNFKMGVSGLGDDQAQLTLWLGASERGSDKQLYNIASDVKEPRVFLKIKPGEWHRYTIIWIKNAEKDDELKTYIDGETVEGSSRGARLTDVTGKLPSGIAEEKWSDIHIGGNKEGSDTGDFSIDELWIFNDPNDSPEKNGLAVPENMKIK